MFKKQTKKNKQSNQQIVQIFTNHCATLIQSRFKGYQQRKYYKKFLPLYRRFKQLLYAGFIGWKMRKILNLNVIKTKSNQIKKHDKNQSSAQYRIAKRDFSDEVVRLSKNGNWVYYAIKQNRALSCLKNSSTIKNQHLKNNKVNLKESLKLINNKVTVKNTKIEKENRISIEIQKMPVQVQYKCQQSLSSGSFKEPSIKVQKQLKQKQNQQKKDKQIQLQIDFEPQLNQINFNVCQTPINQLQEVKKFVFHTKPRQIKKEKQQIQRQYEDAQDSFRRIQLSNFSHRKGGIKMTLSKKHNLQSEDNPIIHPINSRALKQFTQSTKVQHFNPSQENLQQTQSIKHLTVDQNSHLQKTLKIKKDDFQKRKVQHQRRVRQFKISIK